MNAEMEVHFTVNGKNQTVSTFPMMRLLDVLREQVGLTGTKEGCGEGECGACSVLIDGEIVNSCLIPIAQVQGAQIETIESLATDHSLHPLQEAFIQKGGAQCGICTPGMILAAKQLIHKSKDPANLSEQEIRNGLAGNLCRCTGYMKIFDAVRVAGKNMAALQVKA